MFFLGFEMTWILLSLIVAWVFLVTKMTLILLSLTLGLIFLSFQMTKAQRDNELKNNNNNNNNILTWRSLSILASSLNII